MFSRWISSKVKILIIVVLLLFLMVGYYFFKVDDGFDIISIQKKLTFGNKSLFQTEIKWVEDNGKLVGKLKIDKLKSDVTYILENRSIETISFIEQEWGLQIPCLNLIHLLSRKEVKNFYEEALEKAKSTAEGYKIPVNNKIFIDYYQKSVSNGIELHCKMYYIN